MKLFSFLTKQRKQIQRPVVVRYKEKRIEQTGREQFKRLFDKGLQIPIAYL